MEETNELDNPTLSTKRKLHPTPVENQEEEVVNQAHPIKAQKLQSAAAASDNGNASPATRGENTEDATTTPSINNSGSCPQESTERADDEENGPVEEESDGEEGAEGAEEEDVNGEPAVVDRKGKGILIEWEDDVDDSDDDDEDGSELDGDDGSDLEDDPLAEVDLDNILPSRTRRRSVQPGVYIANDIANNDDDNDDDDDDDDDGEDSDA